YKGHFTKVIFNNNCREIIATEKTEYRIYIWNIFQEKPIAQIDVASSEETRDLPQIKYSLRDLQLSPKDKCDRQYLTGASTDSTIKIWDYQKRSLSNTLKGHQDWVYSVRFSPDCRYLFSSGGGSDRSLKIWDFKTGRLLKTIDKAHNGGFYLDVSPDGKLLATVGEQVLKIWDIDSILSAKQDRLNLLYNPEIVVTNIEGRGSEINNIDFSPDGNYLVLGGKDKKITLWQLSKLLDKTVKDSDFKILKVIYDKKNKIIATTGADKTIKLRDKNGKSIDNWSGHKDWVYGLNFSPDGKYIVSGSEDNTVQIRDTKTGRLVFKLQHDEKVYDVNFSPDGKLIAAVSETSLKLWDVDTKKELKSLPIKNDIYWATSLNFSPDPQGELLAVSTEEGVKIYISCRSKNKDNCQYYYNYKLLDAPPNKQNKKTTLLKFIFSNNGKIIATSDTDNNVKLWDVQSGKIIATL
ncbi:MAG: hypothetical protein ACRC80_08745, partial [Waterburya sp.]